MSRCFIYLLLLSMINVSCGDSSASLSFSLKQQHETREGLSGKPEYLSSPMLTAGNRVYLVGHQDGSFPELGWHITGEMSGIWNHPIKLMDGFTAALLYPDATHTLDKAIQFINYPFANVHQFDLPEANLSAERWQFVPDDEEGVLVQYLLHNTGAETQNFDFRFNGYADLRPTWLAEEVEVQDGPDEGSYDSGLAAWVVQDKDNPWTVVFGCQGLEGTSSLIESTYAGQGFAGAATFSITLAPNETKLLQFTIAGSYESEAAAKATYKKIQEQAADLFAQKQERYDQLAAQSKLTIPDKKLEQTFAWLKYNCDWLVRTVPEIGTGIGAGIPDYPWWFGVDSEYALQGYMMIGQETIVNETIELLNRLSESENGNGRIVHEVSTNGVVFNPGNINETPQFASLIWKIYQWNGDRSFLEKYFPTIEKGLAWLMQETDTDQNGFPDGFGMMEIHGLDSEMIDVASYTQAAFADASQMAAILDKDQLATAYQEKATDLQEKINARFWSPEFESYADFIGSDEQALHLIDDAIVRADTLNKPWAVEELQKTRAAIIANPSSTNRPFVLHHNWVVNTPMEMGIADPEKAVLALRTAEKFVNPFGVFVTGIDRDASAGSDDGSFQGSKIFSYTGAVMTLPTGVQAVAENNYGNPDQALNYLQRMTRTFGYALPGSMYEVSPDYGMMAQAWNIYSFAIPIIEQFFGLLPRADQQSIRLQMQMPSHWEEASLENVAVGENNISVYYQKVEEELQVRVQQQNENWTIEFVCPEDYELTGSTTVTKENGRQLIILTGREMEIKLKKIE
ncbi:MAG: glycogen debranching protein [Bacteroidota bacterium]